MSILSKVNSALEEEGLGYVIQRAPHYIRRRVQSKISDDVYRIYNPYGELSRGDMISHCENNDQIWYYGSSEHFEISPPLTGTTPEQLQELVGTYECPESFVCELNDVRLVGDRAIPQLKDGRFVLEEMGTESMLKNRVLETYHSFSRREKIRQIFSRKNTDFGNYDYNSIINMVPRHGASHNKYINYGHWIAEDLPRLRGLKHYCENTERRPDILIKSDPPSWMIKTLQLLGFSPSNWTEWDRNEASIFRLIVPKHSYVHTTGAEFQPSDRAWVSNQMKSYADTSPEADSPKRIFISRQGQGRRKIVNYDEVMASLSEFSFESIRPENFSIEKQIRMFDQAEIIVGPSGSGLVNVIFSDDSSLLEIKPHETKITVWHILATESGLQYDYIRGKQSASNNKKGRNSDIRVNVEDLNNVVSELLMQS